MPTLLKQGTWCTTPKNLEFTDSTTNFRLWIGDVSNRNSFGECVFPLEGNILFFGVDVQTPSLGNFDCHLQKNGSTDVASISYAPSETGRKGVVMDAVYLINDWWNIECHKTGPGFVMRVGFMVAGKL